MSEERFDRLEISEQPIPKNVPKDQVGWGSTRIAYTLEQLLQLAEAFRCNKFRIAATYVVAKTFIWKHWDDEFIVEFIEDFDHIRRGEPLMYSRSLPQSWIDEIYKIVCPKL